MPPTQNSLSGNLRSASHALRRYFVAPTSSRSLGPIGTPGTQRGPKGTQGDLRGPKGDGAMGSFGVIPKPFPMESRFEWRVITKEKHSEMKAVGAFEDYAKE